VLDSLIGTILSQSTTDVNSGRAFAQLKAAFPDWESARVAPVARIEDAIRCGGLAKTKARRIRDILRQLHAERGVTSLEHLRRAPTARIKEELGRLHGVGPKTIACVLLFNLKRPDFPVDTHIHRIVRRLGWLPARATAEQAYCALNALVPDRLTYEFHVLLITHGRHLCRAQRPGCLDCPLWLQCAHAAKVRAALRRRERVRPV
jgi:endonuclease-3